MFELFFRLLNGFILLDEDPGGAGGGGDAAGGEDGTDDEGGSSDEGGESGKGKKDGEKQTHVYMTQFSPEIREKYSGYFESLPYINDLAMAHIKATDRMKNAIIVPDKEKGTPEEIKDFFKKMGIPENAEGYEIKADEKDEDMVALSNEVAKFSSKESFTKTQGQNTFEFIKNLVGIGKKEESERLKKLEDTVDERLLEFHEGDKDKRDETNNRFKAFLVRIGSKEAVEELKKTGLLFDPDFMTRIAGIHKELGDDKFLPGGRKTTKTSKGRMGDYSSDFEDFVGEEGE